MRIMRRKMMIEEEWRILIKRCRSLRSLKSIHASLLRRRSFVDHHRRITTSLLVSGYASLGSMTDAHSLCLFSSSSSSSSSDVILCNVMIKAFLDRSLFLSSLLFYRRMLHLPVFPDHFTFPPLLKASAALLHLPFALQLHQHLFVFGFHSDVCVSNSLVSLYAKLHRCDLSQQVFDKMPLRNVISWSAMIGALSRCDFHQQGISLLGIMLRERIAPNRPAFLNAMACVRTESEADDVWSVVVHGGSDFHKHESV